MGLTLPGNLPRFEYSVDPSQISTCPHGFHPRKNRSLALGIPPLRRLAAFAYIKRACFTLESSGSGYPHWVAILRTATCYCFATAIFIEFSVC